MDIPNWIILYLDTIKKSILETTAIVEDTIKLNKFFIKVNQLKLNKRQNFILWNLNENFVGNITTKKWAKICRCSQDSATRDINDLIKKGYSWKYLQAHIQDMKLFINVKIVINVITKSIDNSGNKH